MDFYRHKEWTTNVFNVAVPYSMSSDPRIFYLIWLYLQILLGVNYLFNCYLQQRRWDNYFKYNSVFKITNEIIFKFHKENCIWSFNFVIKLFLEEILLKNEDISFLLLHNTEDWFYSWDCRCSIYMQK